jgi:hypothetical protein
MAGIQRKQSTYDSILIGVERKEVGREDREFYNKSEFFLDGDRRGERYSGYAL